MNMENLSFGRRSIRWRFLIIINVVAVIGVAGMLVWTTYKIRGEAEQAAIEKVRGDLQLGRSLLESRYPGPWEIRGGQLWKGDLMMNGFMEIVDEVGSKTGDTCTIFQGDVRVATNVMRDGKRAVGTKVADEVAKVVLGEGREYLGEADVVGIKYQTAYMPIRDKENRVVGIWYVGANKSVIDKMILEALRETVLIFVSILVVLILALWKLTGTLIRPISALVQAAKRLAAGDLETALTEFSTDEIGYLSITFEEMRVKLRKHTLQLEGMVHERTVELQVANDDLLEREKKTQMELSLAARVQQDSLPTPFDGDKVRVGTIFEPYSMVSGDFFNYKWFKEENKLCGYIIDVSGHGMATALQTATFKMMLDNVLLTGEKIESGVLKIINKKIMPYLYEGTFVALLYFEFDFQAATLKLISAGITLFLAAKPHDCSLVPISGCYLGLIDNPDIEMEIMPIKTGEIYCMMSDGASDLLELHGLQKQGSFTEYMNWLVKLAESPERRDDFSVICIEILQKKKETKF